MSVSNHTVDLSVDVAGLNGQAILACGNGGLGQGTTGKIPVIPLVLQALSLSFNRNGSFFANECIVGNGLLGNDDSAFFPCATVDTNTVFVAVFTGRIHIVINITLAAVAGVGSVALFGAGRFCLNRHIVVDVRGAVFPNLDIVNGAVTQRMGRGAHIAELEILAIDPGRSGILVGTTFVVLDHGTHFHAVDQQPNHVAAVFGNTVFHAVSMLLRKVQPLAGQNNAVIFESSGVAAQSDKVSAGTTIEVGCICSVAGASFGKKQNAAAAITTNPVAGGFPFQRPGTVVEKINGIGELVLTAAVDAATADTAGNPVQFISVVYREQSTTVIFPSVVFGRGCSWVCGDSDITGDRVNDNFTSLNTACGDVCTAHSNGDDGLVACGYRYRAGESLAVFHSISGTLSNDSIAEIIGYIVGYATEVSAVFQDGRGEAPGECIHTGRTRMQGIICHKGFEIAVSANATIVIQVNNICAKFTGNLGNGVVELLGKLYICCGLVEPRQQSEAINFCVGVALRHFVQHNGIGFANRRRSSVGEAVAVICDQRIIANGACSTQFAGRYGKIVGTQIYRNNIGRFPQCVM